MVKLIFILSIFFIEAHERIGDIKVIFQEPDEWNVSSGSYDSVSTTSSEEFDGWIISLRKIDYSSISRPKAYSSPEKHDEKLKTEVNYDDFNPLRFVLTSFLKTELSQKESLITAQIDGDGTRVRYLVVGDRPTEGEILVYPFFKNELDVQRPLTLIELNKLACGNLNGTIVSDKYAYKINPISNIKVGGNSFWSGFTEVNVDFNVNSKKISHRLLKDIETHEMPVILFDIKDGFKMSRRVASHVTPNRVYLVKENDKWGYVLSNAFSEFELPLQFLRAGSIVSGSFLGGKTADRYLLTTEGRWVKTFKDEIKYFWIHDKKPKIKIESYLPITKSTKKSEKVVYEKKVVFDAKSEELKFSPKLYDVETDSLIESSGQILPERVYAVYMKEKKSWFFTLSTKKGTFTEPLEVIYYNTVLPGKYLGVKTAFLNYRFTKKWGWKPTKRNEEYFYWVLSSPQLFKRVMFFDPAENTCSAGVNS